MNTSSPGLWKLILGLNAKNVFPIIPSPNKQSSKTDYNILPLVIKGPLLFVLLVGMHTYAFSQQSFTFTAHSWIFLKVNIEGYDKCAKYDENDWGSKNQLVPKNAYKSNLGVD